MEAFKVENLTFRYPETGVDVLKDICFCINKGEFITLCGPSGCGKSTLLRNMKPVLAPVGIKSGKILFNGSEISTLSQREQSEKIGYVMQSPDNQIVTDKVWHELAFGLESLGLENSAIKRKIAETACYFGIEDLFYKNIHELSGGQKQRVAIVRALCMHPEVLLFDEVTAALDPEMVREVLDVMVNLAKEGRTMVIVTHQLEFARAVADRIVFIDEGKIVEISKPEQFFNNPKTERARKFLKAFMFDKVKNR